MFLADAEQAKQEQEKKCMQLNYIIGKFTTF